METMAISRPALADCRIGGDTTDSDFTRKSRQALRVQLLLPANSFCPERLLA
jgi:hypothetical protein